MSADLARALLASLDDDALDELAARLAPRLTEWMAARGGDGWLSGADAIGAYIGAPASRVYALSSAGRIPVHRDGRGLRAKRTDLDGWIADGGANRP